MSGVFFQLTSLFNSLSLIGMKAVEYRKEISYILYFQLIVVLLW